MILKKAMPNSKSTLVSLLKCVTHYCQKKKEEKKWFCLATGISILILVATANLAMCQETKTSYELWDDEGIMTERFSKDNHEENKFTSDNKIFKTDSERTYSYVYIGTDKKRYLCSTDQQLGDNNKIKWTLVPETQKTENVITSIRMTVLSGLQGFEKVSPDYSQSVINYQYLAGERTIGLSEKTGLIENEANIWMHPPRLLLFQILEINPFPFIYLDQRKSWNWSLKVGANWSDQRWKNWSGSITGKMKYEKQREESIQTKFGKLKCRVSSASSTSELGETYLKSYFHNDYGFVKLEYTNIDGSRIILDLTGLK